MSERIIVTSSAGLEIKSHKKTRCKVRREEESRWGYESECDWAEEIKRGEKGVYRCLCMCLFLCLLVCLFFSFV